jgi:septal ring factor EnvC (AmiA/AmiB activator)|tara:strand:- start:303 stop:500 length:198 start_codon:yes stop_codon:yes gene_type:complete
MPVGNAEYFDNLNKEIKEKQSELSLSSSKVVAMKQMIADRDKEIKKLKFDLIMSNKHFAMKEWGK